MGSVPLFLSAVTNEFGACRTELRRRLKTHEFDVHVQEDFISTGTPTLDKLDLYILECRAVIHVVGDMTGAVAKKESLEIIRRRYPDLIERLPFLRAAFDAAEPDISYTQWEAYLALYHRKPLLVAMAKPGVPRETKYQNDERQRLAQAEHLELLKTLERYPILFDSAADLAAELLRSLVGLLADARSSGTTLDKLQVNLLLALLDREDAIGDIVEDPSGGLQVVYGTHDCVADDLYQRLRDVELPWLTRDGGRDAAKLSRSEWRSHVVRGAEPVRWVRHWIPWPLDGDGPNRRGGSGLVEWAHDRFVDRLLGKLANDKSASAASLDSWFDQLAAQPDRYLISSSVDDHANQPKQAAELIGSLARTFRGAPQTHLRLVIYIRTMAPRLGLGWLRRNSIVQHLSRETEVALVPLQKVLRDHLEDWATLSEGIAEVGANMVMEAVDRIYAEKCSGRFPIIALSGGPVLAALPMKTLREQLKRHVEEWSLRRYV